MSMMPATTRQSDEQPETLSTERLWEEFARTRAVEYRNELLLRNIDLVRRAVSRLYAAAHHYHDYDDLLSCGVIGLMDAFDRFDPGRGTRFESYAMVRIRGEIVDYMRRQDWAPTHLRLRLRQVEAAVSELSQTLGRAPTDPETADFMQMPLSELQELMGESHCLNVVHLDDLLAVSREEDPALAHDAQFDRAYEKEELQALLRTELGRLSEKEQRILSLYYEDELTLKEIGQILQLSESRISQIHSSTLLKLRTRLNLILNGLGETEPGEPRPGKKRGRPAGAAKAAHPAQPAAAAVTLGSTAAAAPNPIPTPIPTSISGSIPAAVPTVTSSSKTAGFLPAQPVAVRRKT